MGKYWGKVCEIQKAQTEKGIKKYGQVLEDNKTLTPTERITYLQEEMIDGLMYCEHLKVLLHLANNSADEYQIAALRTSNLSKEPFSDKLMNGALGLCGEAGELADYVKKYRFQGHNLNTDHLINELGDVMWYVATTANTLGVSLSYVMEQNIQKLTDRYPNGFDADRSVNRKDEQK